MTCQDSSLGSSLDGHWSEYMGRRRKTWMEVTGIVSRNFCLMPDSYSWVHVDGIICLFIFCFWPSTVMPLNLMGCLLPDCSDSNLLISPWCPWLNIFNARSPWYYTLYSFSFQSKMSHGYVLPTLIWNNAFKIIAPLHHNGNFGKLCIAPNSEQKIIIHISTGNFWRMSFKWERSRWQKEMVERRNGL